MPEDYLGPCTLAEALAGATPSGKIRLAVSVPNGDLVAVQVGDRKPQVRRADRKSGHAGSVVGTGEWLRAEDVPPPVAWRPA